MAIVDITSALEKLAQTEAGLSRLEFYLYNASDELEDKDPDQLQIELQHFSMDAREVKDKLAQAIAIVSNLAGVERSLIQSEFSNFTGYNFSQSGAVHAVAVLVSGLMVSTLKRRGYCACDATGPCAAHAQAFNELHDAEIHLTKAAKAFVNAKA